MKEIYKRLGLKTDISNERKKFINRMQLVADYIGERVSSKLSDTLDHEVSFRLGTNEEDFSSYLQKADFDETLLWCEVVVAQLSEYNEEVSRYLQGRITQALEESLIDLGIIYKEAKFYRKGAEELDQTLIIETLDWLKEYPAARDSFGEALKEYLRKDYADAITKCYSALESITKEYVGSDKGLDNLIPELLSKLSLSEQWKSILASFCKYAHEFGSRHGKRKGAHARKLNLGEVEAYIYQTGLIMRLICRGHRRE